MPEHIWPADNFTATRRMVQCPDCLGHGFDLGSVRQPEQCPTCAGYGDILHPDEVEQIRKKLPGREDQLKYLKRQPEYQDGFGRFGT